MKASLFERIEKEKQIIDLFANYLEGKNKPVKMQEFLDDNMEELEKLYSISSFTTLFSKFREQKLIEVVHYRNKPTPSILTNQEFILPNFKRKDVLRDWVNFDEKKEMREVFIRKVLDNPDEVFLKEAVSFVGSFPTKEENLSFMVFLFEKVFRVKKQPMTTKEVVDFIIEKEEDEAIFNTLLGTMRLAKSAGCFQDVYLKGEKKRNGYMVPTSFKSSDVANRNWLYPKEWRETTGEEMHQDWLDKRKKQSNEVFTYQSLLADKHYAVYLMAKLKRLTWMTNKDLMKLQLSDYNPIVGSLLIRIEDENGIHFSGEFILDKHTNSLMSIWIKQRCTFMHADSPFLFIPKKKKQFKDANSFMLVFKKYAKMNEFVPSLQYHDRGKQLRRLGNDNSSTEKRSLAYAIKWHKVEWFEEIERIAIKNSIK